MNNKLNIIFICSCLEAGRDGVGDYTRRLAIALIKNGHQAAAVSLNDRHVSEVYDGWQTADGGDLQVLRLPSITPFDRNIEVARAWIDEREPSWLSLQYVPFGYHPKGLRFGLGRSLSQLGNSRKWDVMVHELWVGMASEESLKLKLWGTVQRMLIGSLLKTLKPGVIHTQTVLYQQHLKRMGFDAKLLPLYGNIQVTAAESLPAQEITLVIFGAIHDRAPVADLAADAAAYQKSTGKTVKLLIIGRGNAEQQRWSSIWANAGLPVDILGEQSEQAISTIFNTATLGLSATALAVIEKSGSYAAMREHGLQVLSVSKPWTPRGIGFPHVPDGVLIYKKGQFADLLLRGQRMPYQHNVSSVSVKFAEDLLTLKSE